jgi:hypothetical protein
MKFIESHPQLVEKFSMPTHDSTKKLTDYTDFTDTIKNNLWSSVKSVRTELNMKFIESHPQLVEKFSMPTHDSTKKLTDYTDFTDTIKNNL